MYLSAEFGGRADRSFWKVRLLDAMLPQPRELCGYSTTSEKAVFKSCFKYLKKKRY
jgi:hypothetical protein